MWVFDSSVNTTTKSSIPVVKKSLKKKKDGSYLVHFMHFLAFFIDSMQD